MNSAIRTRRALENYVRPDGKSSTRKSSRCQCGVPGAARRAGYPIRRDFVVGLPRSGSTLIEQILASHSQVDATHELPEAGRLIQRINRDRIDRVTYPIGARLLERGLGCARPVIHRTDAAVSPRCTSLLSTRCRNNFASIGLLSLHCQMPGSSYAPPSARHCLSCYTATVRAGPAFTYDLVELGEYNLQYDGMMRHWTRSAGRVLDVPVTNRSWRTRARDSGACGTIAATLGGRMRALLRDERAIRTASSEQVATGRSTRVPSPSGATTSASSRHDRILRRVVAEWHETHEAGLSSR